MSRAEVWVEIEKVMGLSEVISMAQLGEGRVGSPPNVDQIKGPKGLTP